MHDGIQIHGRYECVFRHADGTIFAIDHIDNLVPTAAKNYLLDNFLAGSAFTQTGPYMGLISSTSYSTIVAGDTMASHSGWLEAGSANTPHYSGNRKTAVFSAASGGSKALSSSLSFVFTGSGTVKGGFLVLGASAVNTIDNTSGVLWSAALFSGGDKIVSSSDSLAISYSASL